MAMLSEEQLQAMGFASVGHSVQISDKASFYGAARIHIASHVRIDDFCVLSAGEGGIDIGNYVHIAVFVSIIGAGSVRLSDYSCLSSRVSVYSSNDDYSGRFMTNPTVPAEFTNVSKKNVLVGRHVVVGSGSIILPGVTVNDGVAIGALSLVKDDCESFGVYAGTPAKRIKDRKRDLLELEAHPPRQNCCRLERN